MTGIERLREFAEGISPFTVVCGVTTTSYDREHKEVDGARLRGFLSDIVDQIERERACDADTIENLRLELGEARDDAAWVRDHGGLDSVKETVFDKNTGEELVVTGFEDGRVWCEHRMTDADALPVRGMWSPGQLTHERPIADTWERLEEDAGKDPCGYFGFDGEETCGKCPASGKNCEQTMALDIVRRARALAEKENRNE